MNLIMHFVDDQSQSAVDAILFSTIGEGSSAFVYVGNVEDHIAIIKIEPYGSKIPQIDNEIVCLKQLETACCKGVPQVLFSGHESNGFVAYEVLLILKQVHCAGVIHRDVKPSHIVFSKNGTFLLIDFGVATTKTNKIGFAGTVDYASMRSLLGLPPHAKDDLESLAYSLFFLAQGFLPWEDYTGIEKMACKQHCGDNGSLFANFPGAFGEYFNYVRKLKTEEQPDYGYLLGLFYPLKLTASHYPTTTNEW